MLALYVIKQAFSGEVMLVHESGHLDLNASANWKLVIAVRGLYETHWQGIVICENLSLSKVIVKLTG